MERLDEQHVSHDSLQIRWSRDHPLTENGNLLEGKYECQRGVVRRKQPDRTTLVESERVHGCYAVEPAPKQWVGHAKAREDDEQVYAGCALSDHAVQNKRHAHAFDRRDPIRAGV